MSLASALRVTDAAGGDPARALDETALAGPHAEPAALRAAFAHELLLARCAALEAYERAVPRLLERLAQDVLGRELRLAPANLQTIANRVRRAFAAEEPVALVVSHAAALSGISGLPVRVDPSLAAEDLIVEVCDGELEARFAIRVRHAVREALAS